MIYLRSGIVSALTIKAGKESTQFGPSIVRSDRSCRCNQVGNRHRDQLSLFGINLLFQSACVNCPLLDSSVLRRVKEKKRNMLDFTLLYHC